MLRSRERPQDQETTEQWPERRSSGLSGNPSPISLLGGDGIAGQYPSRNSPISKDERLSSSSSSIPDEEPNPEVTGYLRQTSRPQGSGRLESEEQDLTELAAPAPAHEDDTSGWHKEEHLEDVRRWDGSPRGPHQHSNLLTQLYIISGLIFFSLLGVLARLGVQWLTLYPGAPVLNNNLWANFGGTLFMGFLAEDRKVFREEWGEMPAQQFDADKRMFIDVGKSRGNPEQRAAHSKVKKTIPLFIGLTTGFCGTFTSFSTFLRDVFYALENGLPSPINHPTTPPSTSTHSTVSRNNGYSVEAILAITILTICASNGALYLGAHMAIGLDRFTPTIPFRFIRYFLDPFILILGPGCWLGAIFMTVWPPDRPGGPAAHSTDWRAKALFALVFAPLGCLMRFYLSLKLNAVIPSFPLGTFASNIFGVAVLSMSYALQHVPLGSAALQIGGGLIGCQVLQGIEDGFCGALTTVSTWILELNTLRRRHAYMYGATSVIVGLALTVVIMGSVRWSLGFRSALCYPGGT